MPRLPKPGGDADKWANLLNEYLLVAHNPDGTPRKDLNELAATVGLTDLRVTNPPTEQIKNYKLSNDGTNLAWRKDTVINVHDYGALGDGVTDDTAITSHNGGNHLNRRADDVKKLSPVANVCRATSKLMNA